MPDADGVPLIVITSFAQDAATPAGKPVAVPIPVASEVLCVILVNAELIHSVGVLDAIPAVFVITVIVPIAFALPQSPVNGIE